MTITIIVCNNGIGHLKRVLSIIKKIIKLDNRINFKIYTDKNNLVHFEKSIQELEDFFLQVIHFTSEVENYEKRFLKSFEYELLNADNVWSDNLSFPIKYNANCILTGSFLWADQLSNKYRVSELKSLDKYFPKMIGAKYFSTDTVRKSTDFHGVGLYNYMPRNRSYKNSKSLLISCGNSQAGVIYFKKILDDIIKAVPKVNDGSYIYLEPCLYDLLKNKNYFKKATYCSKMYNDVGVAVIRPGLGTICDLWSMGIKIFPVYEPDNHEMQHNSNVISKLQGDKICSLSIQDAILSAISYNKNKYLKKECKIRLDQLEFNGIEKTAEIILDNLD